MKRAVGLCLVTFVVLALNAGCSDQTSKGDTIASNPGRWSGFVVDGKSGAKLDFFTTDGEATNAKDDNAAADQVYVLVNGDLVSAKPCGTETAALGFQAGCFTVDNLPTGTYLPVFVKRASYHPFSGTILIDPTVVDASYPGDAGTGPIFADKPQLYKNVRIFPLDGNYDYTVHTYDTGTKTAVASATVRCVFMTQTNFDMVLNAGGTINYVAPSNDFAPIVTATTDASGNATIPGTGLVKGGTYKCYANTEDLGNGGAMANTAGVTFVVGVSDPQVEIAMTAAFNNLVAIWSNIDDPNTAIGAAGPVTVVFNRPVTIMSGTTDCQYGSVASVQVDGTIPTLITSVDNDVSESIAVTVDSTGTIVTVVPNFDAGLGITSGDRIVDFAFYGIYLQVAAGENSDKIYRLGGAPATTGAFTLSAPIVTPATCTALNALGNVTAITNQTLAGPQPSTGRLVN